MYILLLWTVHLTPTGADDPCRYVYCGGGTCNNVTGVCDCPEGREGRYCEYQKGGEACTHQTLPLHPHFPSLETFSPTYVSLKPSAVQSSINVKSTVCVLDSCPLYSWWGCIQDPSQSIIRHTVQDSSFPTLIALWCMLCMTYA